MRIFGYPEKSNLFKLCSQWWYSTDLQLSAQHDYIVLARFSGAVCFEWFDDAHYLHLALLHRLNVVYMSSFLLSVHPFPWSLFCCISVVQERLTKDIAMGIRDAIEPTGVAVVIEAS